MAEPTRPTLRGVTPYLTVRGAKEAIEFYKRAFGAEEVMRMDAQDGKRLMHAHIKVNGGDILMSDEFPEYGTGLGGGPVGVTLHLAVDDADRWWKRAVDAGAKVKMPLEDQFWGDRYGQLSDPFGHSWSIGAPTRKQRDSRFKAVASAEIVQTIDRARATHALLQRTGLAS